MIKATSKDEIVSQPLVTVIIPNYNKSMYLEQCIGSVALQSYRPIEILVIDDCSTDQSITILDKLKRKYSMLNVISLKENGGVSHARNVGIECSKGSILTMLDSDDYYINSKKIENEVCELLRDKSKFAFSYSRTVLTDAFGERVKTQPVKETKYLTGNILVQLIKCKKLGIVPRDYCFWKSTVIDSELRYNENLNFFEDIDFTMQLAAKCSVYYTHEEGTGYRQNTNGLSNKSEKIQYRRRWTISWKNIHLLKNPICKFEAILSLLIFRTSFEMKLLIKKILRK